MFYPLADAKELKMLIWSDELTPIIYWDAPTRAYKGILIDIFSGLPKEDEITFTFLLDNRARGEFALYEANADLSIFSKEWMKHPEKLIYSEPIYVQREFLYANSPIKSAPLEEIIKNKVICTRRGYIYPELEPFFDEGIASRMDSGFELSQFKMLRRGRCDFVMADEFVGGLVIEKNGWRNEVYQTDQAISRTNFTIAFHPSMQATMDVVNTHIMSIKNSRVLAEIIHTERSAVATIKQAAKKQ